MEFANNRLTWKTSTIPFLVLLAATLTTDRCPGEIWHDSLAPMNWEAMKSCDLIFAGKYVSHKDKSLTLQVTEVLRGGAGVGQHVTVELEHHYSVEMGQVGWARIFETGTKPNRIAKLCYKQQITPDDPVPVPLLNDFRSGALYFIPDEVRPALTRLKQVQPLLFLEGWQQAIRDESMNLPFRLAQHVDRDVSRNALEELGVTRDAACLDQLFAWILDPALQGSFSPEAVLSRIGDRNGDVYDRAAKLVKQNAPGSNPYRFAALTGLMAVVDPARASEELQSLLVSDRPLIVRTAALLGMGRLQDRKTAVLTFDAMQDNELAEAAFTSIRSRLRPNEDYRFPKTHHFENTDWLLAQLRLSTTNEEVPDSIRRRIADYFGHELRDATQLDLDVLRTLLLDPGNRIHHGWADGETAELLRQATEARDPRLVPILCSNSRCMA